MKEALHSMLRRYSFQSLHNDLVVVHLYIGLRIDGGQLMLGRRYFIVLGFSSNAQLPQFLIYMLHIRRNSLTDGSQIMIIHLLTFGSHSSNKSPSGKYQIFSFAEFFFADQKILLFRSY